MKNNTLFTVTNLKLIPQLKGLGISKFVYPLSFFCVGIPNTFSIEDIKEENAYIFINRVLDCKAIDELDKILHNLPSNIKGVIFDDLGLIEILKDIHIEKILFYSHFNTNYHSINYFFEYVDEIIISTDISECEIDEIIANTNKKISVFSFGLVSSLYSRRTLLTNYALQYKKEVKTEKDLRINDKRFIAIENEFGTVLYHYPYYDASRLLNKDVKYFFYFPILLEDDNVLNVARNDFAGIETDQGFLDIKTIYKVKNN